ncbi:DUF3300 domain-containing protein [Candidimonas sp. SYP-B2681]|nr:DUF3300 domain-containing protein [Candidimonas sp. SYP-B2681]RTZ48293.1 DUF3300 domain-containing protein [Candidimonas sp. SYP-B2681]
MFSAVWTCFLLLALQPAYAQTKLDNAQLDQLLAPIALYPDALLSQVLMAATYPDDIAAAAAWSASHTSLSGDAAAKAVEGESWDPSVKSLTAFPSVIDLLGRQPKWTQSLGDTFLAQPEDVMSSVQRLRAQAKKAGNLESGKQQKVVTDTSGSSTIVKIEPTDPQTVYVPVYDSTTVYGAWPYQAYPPYYYPAPPGSVFATSLVAGVGFGLAVGAVNSLWGGFNWGSNDVDINVNRYNNINANNRINSNNARAKWEHNAANRGSTPYRDPAVRTRNETQRQAGLNNRSPSVQSRDVARDRAAQSVERQTGQSTRGTGTTRQRQDAGGSPGGRSDARSNTGTSNNRSAADRQNADRVAAQDRSRDMNRSSAVRDAGNGEQARQQSRQGHTAQTRASGPSSASRSSSASRPSGGGGRASGGGRGGSRR